MSYFVLISLLFLTFKESSRLVGPVTKLTYLCTWSASQLSCTILTSFSLLRLPFITGIRLFPGDGLDCGLHGDAEGLQQALHPISIRKIISPCHLDDFFAIMA